MKKPHEDDFGSSQPIRLDDWRSGLVQTRIMLWRNRAGSRATSAILISTAPSGPTRPRACLIGYGLQCPGSFLSTWPGRAATQLSGCRGRRARKCRSDLRNRESATSVLPGTVRFATLHRGPMEKMKCQPSSRSQRVKRQTSSHCLASSKSALWTLGSMPMSSYRRSITTPGSRSRIACFIATYSFPESERH